MRVYLLIVLVCSCALMGQQNLKIIDFETKQPIPYAKVILDDGTYKNAENDGIVYLEDEEKPTEIQSYGYQNLKVTQFQNTYSLHPIVKQISEIEIYRPRFKNKYLIGTLKTSKAYFEASTQTWIAGKEISFDRKIKNPLFIEKVGFDTKIHHKRKATIKMNFYMNESGLPGELIESTTISCQQGKNYYKLPKPLILPKEGFIIGMEWIINNENQYEANETNAKTGEKSKQKGCNPSIRAVQNTGETFIIGEMVEGDWKFTKTKLRTSITALALEVTLTD